MNKIQIAKGKHQPPLIRDLHTQFPFIHFGKEQIKFEVEFNNTALYDIREFSDDTNKLYGISFNNMPWKHNGKWKKPHHLNSLRIGWVPAENYRDIINKIHLVSYQYVNGQRIRKIITDVKINSRYEITCNIDYAKKIIEIWVKPLTFFATGSIIQLPFDYNHKISYYLGSYFGGELPAMKHIEWEWKRVA